MRAVEKIAEPPIRNGGSDRRRHQNGGEGSSGGGKAREKTRKVRVSARKRAVVAPADLHAARPELPVLVAAKGVALALVGDDERVHLAAAGPNDLVALLWFACGLMNLLSRADAQRGLKRAAAMEEH